MKLIRRITGSRLGHLLFAIHLTLAVLALSSKPPAENSVLTDCQTIPIAGRAIQLSLEPTWLKMLVWLDLPALIIDYALSLLIWTAATPFNWRMNIYVFSWINAVTLFLLTGFEWLVVGFCVQWFIDRREVPARGFHTGLTTSQYGS